MPHVPRIDLARVSGAIAIGSSSIPASASSFLVRVEADKQHAFREAQQHPTQLILDRCAEAYFSAREWPERMWRHLGTLSS